MGVNLILQLRECFNDLTIRSVRFILDPPQEATQSVFLPSAYYKSSVQFLHFCCLMKKKKEIPFQDHQAVWLDIQSTHPIGDSVVQTPWQAILLEEIQVDS